MLIIPPWVQRPFCWRPGDWPLRLLHNGQPVLRQAVVSNKYFLFKQPISPPIWFAAVAIVGADKPLIFGLASIGLPFLLSMATPCKNSESCPAAITDTRPIAIVVFGVQWQASKSDLIVFSSAMRRKGVIG